MRIGGAAVILFFYKLTLFESGVEFSVVILDVGDFNSGPRLV